ncbi:MAG: S1 RNA-binding domain-containing protein [Candidatus Micrarchaeia archaeon]
MNYPSLDELVLVTVKKLLPYGALVVLDEYDSAEAFIHISQVSRGWTKNVSEYLRPGQKTVVRVIRLDPDKRQIDASLKSVSESEKRAKLEAFQSGKRALKLLERAAILAKGKAEDALKEAGEPLVEEYGDLYSAFEALSQGALPKAKIPKKWLDALTQVAKNEIKHKNVEVAAVLRLKFYGGAGLNELKAAIAGLEAKTGLKAHYVSAGAYSIKSVAAEYKAAEKALDDANAFLEKALAGNANAEYALER